MAAKEEKVNQETFLLMKDLAKTIRELGVEASKRYPIRGPLVEGEGTKAGLYLALS